MPQPAIVEVADLYVNPSSGSSVAFVPKNDGSALPATVETDAAGSASTFWPIGVTLSERVLEVRTPSLAPAVVTALVRVRGPAVASTMSENLQLPAQHNMSVDFMTVRVTDFVGEPVADVQVGFSR